MARVVDLLLANAEKYDIDPNHTDNYGMTGLMYACKEKEFYVIATFWRKAYNLKIDFDLKDPKYGRTAYIWACYHGKKQDGIYEEFKLNAKRLKINLNLKDKSGKTGADYMKQSLKSGIYIKENRHYKGIQNEKKRYGKYMSGYFGSSSEESGSDSD